MSIGDAIASTIMQGSAQSNASLREGFSAIARSVELSNQRAFEKPMRDVQMAAEQQKTDYYKFQQEKEESTFAQDKAVQAVYESVASQDAAQPGFKETGTPNYVAVAQRLQYMGYNKEAKDALNAMVEHETQTHTQQVQKLTMATALSTSLADSAAGILSAKPEQQEFMYKQLASTVKEQYGMDIDKQFDKNMSATQKLTVLRTTSKEARKASTDLMVELIKATNDHLTQAKGAATLARQNGNSDLANAFDSTAKVLRSNATAAVAHVVAQTKETELKMSKTEVESYMTALTNHKLISTNSKGIPDEDIGPAFNASKAVGDLLGIPPMTAVEIVKTELTTEGGGGFLGLFKDKATYGLKTSDGKEVKLTPNDINSALIASGKFTQQTVGQASPEDRIKIFSALTSQIKSKTSKELFGKK